MWTSPMPAKTRQLSGKTCWALPRPAPTAAMTPSSITTWPGWTLSTSARTPSTITLAMMCIHEGWRRGSSTKDGEEDHPRRTRRNTKKTKEDEEGWSKSGLILLFLLLFSSFLLVFFVFLRVLRG